MPPIPTIEEDGVAQPHPSRPFDDVINRINAALAEQNVTPDFAEVHQVGVTFAEDGLERHRAVLRGAPMSVLHDSDWRPADEPQELVDACPPRPPEPPAVWSPFVDPRGMVQAHQPWWKRLFGRSA